MLSIQNHLNFSVKTLLLIAFILVYTLFSSSIATARPNFTEEELTKARKAASGAKPPIDFDALMDEVDRLGIECEGDLTDWGWLEICRVVVKSAQARERTAASKKRVEESRKRQAEIQKETARLIHEAADKAERKLKQMKEQ